MSEILPCPFCGKEASFIEPSECFGTYYEYDCDCGLARVSIQISDLMSREERFADPFTDYQYSLEYIERAREEAKRIWNTRI